MTPLLPLLALLAATAAAGGPITVTDDGTAVTLANANGVSATFTRGGAALQKLLAPDRDGKVDDIVLGLEDAKAYETPNGNPQMMGCIVGRFINRIAGASFPLNGSTVRLTPNMPTGAAIHGGGADGGWCMRRWNVTRTTADSVTFALTSPAGDQGFPGGVNASVTYSLSADNTVTAVLTATADALTAANIAPHPYFNLDGAAARTHVRGHELASPATLRTVVDVGSLLPTGAVVAVAGTAFDFHTSTLLGARWDAIPPDATEPGVGGYEVQYVLGGGATGAAARAAVVNCSRPGPPTPAATLHSPSTGRTLTLATNAPALVVYTSTHLGGGGYVPKGGGTPYPQYSAVALEPQDPTDWVHHTDTFSTCYLSPRESMRRVWTLKVGVEGRNG